MKTRKRSDRTKTRKRGKGNLRKTLRGGIFTSKSRKDSLMFILSLWEKIFNTFPSYNDIKLYWDKKNGTMPSKGEVEIVQAKLETEIKNPSKRNSLNLWENSDDGVFHANVYAKMPQPTNKSLSNDSKKGGPNSAEFEDISLN
uniref:Uncharacterized protein n=1 Tax=viral metagenome TaxID=1070528 RepID=A0A6C0HS41_9ZZZZ